MTVNELLIICQHFDNECVFKLGIKLLVINGSNK